MVRKRLDLFDQATQPGQSRAVLFALHVCVHLRESLTGVAFVAVLEFYRKKYPKLVHNIHCETSPEGYKRVKPIMEAIAAGRKH